MREAGDLGQAAEQLLAATAEIVSQASTSPSSLTPSIRSPAPKALAHRAANSTFWRGFWH